jgi:hypothetical protein
VFRGQLAGGVDAAFVLPPRAAFVIDLPLGKEPLAGDLEQLVFVVPEAANGVGSLRVVVADVKPLGAADRTALVVFFIALIPDLRP